MLMFQSAINCICHVDFTLRGVSLGVVLFASNNGFPYQDLAALKVHVLPLEAINFTGTHAGEKAHDVIVFIVGV